MMPTDVKALTDDQEQFLRELEHPNRVESKLLAIINQLRTTPALTTEQLDRIAGCRKRTELWGGVKRKDPDERANQQVAEDNALNVDVPNLCSIISQISNAQPQNWMMPPTEDEIRAAVDDYREPISRGIDASVEYALRKFVERRSSQAPSHK